MANTPSSWTIDPVHSSVEFSLDYMGFSTYRTGFRALEGSLQFDAADPQFACADLDEGRRIRRRCRTHAADRSKQPLSSRPQTHRKTR